MTDHEDFNFSKYDKEEFTPLVLSADMLRRRLVWDTVPCSIATDVMLAMELPPASEEVEETEHDGAHARMDGIEPIVKVLYQLTSYTTEAICAAMMVSLGERISNSDIMEIEKIHPLLFQSTVAVLSELVDIGIVELNAPTMIVRAEDV